MISLFNLRRKAPRWSADRVVKKYPQFFSWNHVKTLADTEPIYFTGEMVRLFFIESSW